MITNEQKEQIESLATDEIHSEIMLYRLSQVPRDERYDYLKACYQQRTADHKSSSKQRDWQNPLLVGMTAAAVSVFVVFLVNDYFGFSL